jgi:uncharacterized protein involved in response to NO
MWPMLYRGMLDFYPGPNHARVMVQAFCGAFVIGFLGTAGPRILSAPRLKPWELVPLFALHLANGVCHLRGMTFQGDLFFLLLLVGFATSMAVRLFFLRKDLPPPPMLLAGTGLACGIAGTLLWMNPEWMTTMAVHRLAGLLLYQGFLLGPVMGVGIFLFPRLLGGEFGEPAPGAQTRRSLVHMAIAGAAMLASFAIEVWWHHGAGVALRVAALVFALGHVRWIRARGSAPAGTLANAMRIWSLPLAVAGITASAFFYPKHIAFEHLLFASGFGLLCLIAGSRVLFGHSGSLARFAARSWIARIIVLAAVLAALTRLSADFLPRVMISHYEYAAFAWVAAAGLWLVWHAGRFFKRDEVRSE